MRVAVHFPAGHELAPGEDGQESQGAVVAYRLGRIEDGVHNAPVGHEPVSLEEFVQRLVAQAQEEYPDAEVVVERLVANEDGTARWISASEFDPEQHRPVAAGQTIVREVTADLTPGAVTPPAQGAPVASAEIKPQVPGSEA